MNRRTRRSGKSCPGSGSGYGTELAQTPLPRQAPSQAVLPRGENPCREGLPRRFRSSTLRACGAGRLALERSSARTSSSSA